MKRTTSAPRATLEVASLSSPVVLSPRAASSIPAALSRVIVGEPVYLVGSSGLAITWAATLACSQTGATRP